jgi:hypothetical protein
MDGNCHFTGYIEYTICTQWQQLLLREYNMSHHKLIASDEGSCKAALFDILQHDAGKNSCSKFIHPYF